MNGGISTCPPNIIRRAVCAGPIAGSATTGDQAEPGCGGVGGRPHHMLEFGQDTAENPGDYRHIWYATCVFRVTLGENLARLRAIGDSTGLRRCPAQQM